VYRQIQRNRHIEVRFAGNPEQGVSLIRSDPKVRDVQMNTRSCVVELDGEETDVQRLLRQLVAADCGVVSFAEKEPTLEDVFMMVTKGLVT
jgi:ABC-2 type transport system ATP-binding protein